MLQCGNMLALCSAIWDHCNRSRLADPPSAPRAHSSILLLWWNPRRGLKRPRLFLSGRMNAWQRASSNGLRGALHASVFCIDRELAKIVQLSALQIAPPEHHEDLF